MNNIGQIVEEADEKIGQRLHDLGIECYSDFSDIIKAACEKAVEQAHKRGMNQGWNEGREHERKSQPKGEPWTVESVQSLCKLQLSKRDLQAIADAHNASIGADRKEGEETWKQSHLASISNPAPKVQPSGAGQCTCGAWEQGRRWGTNPSHLDYCRLFKPSVHTQAKSDDTKRLCSKCGQPATEHLCPTLATGRATQTFAAMRKDKI